MVPATPKDSMDFERITEIEVQSSKLQRHLDRLKRNFLADTDVRDSMYFIVMPVLCVWSEPRV